MVINSVKPFGEVIMDVIALPSKIEWSNYTYVMDKMQYGKLFLNNVIITVIGIVGIIIFSSMSAYIISRKKNKYTRFAQFMITTPMLIPFQTIMITLLKVMNVVNLSGSKVGLGIQYWGFGIPMAAFIYGNFMSTIPKELDESAFIDGAGTFRTYRSIIFPASEICNLYSHRNRCNVDLETSFFHCLWLTAQTRPKHWYFPLIHS